MPNDIMKEAIPLRSIATAGELRSLYGLGDQQCR